MVFVFSLAGLAGPVTYIVSHSGKPDPNHLYLVLDLGGKSRAFADPVALGARAVGPQRGILADMMEASPNTKDRLEAAGYVVLPGGALAALCGFEPSQTKKRVARL